MYVLSRVGTRSAGFRTVIVLVGVHCGIGPFPDVCRLGLQHHDGLRIQMFHLVNITRQFFSEDVTVRLGAVPTQR